MTSLLRAGMAVAVALGISMTAGCDRPSDPNRSPGPGSGVPQPKTAAKDPASAGATGLPEEKPSKQPSAKY